MVTRPRLLRPPCEIRPSVRAFTGRPFHSSERSIRTSPRWPGVVGLYDLSAMFPVFRLLQGLATRGIGRRSSPLRSAAGSTKTNKPSPDESGALAWRGISRRGGGQHRKGSFLSTHHRRREAAFRLDGAPDVDFRDIPDVSRFDGTNLRSARPAVQSADGKPRHFKRRGAPERTCFGSLGRRCPLASGLKGRQFGPPPAADPRCAVEIVRFDNEAEYCCTWA